MAFGFKKKKREIEDDSRSFANMNVEGLPWYRPEQLGEEKKGEKTELTPKEYKYFIFGTLKAAFLILFTFVAVYFLFILFLDVVVFHN